MSRHAFSPDAALAIAAAHDNRPERLVQILVDFVKQFGWVPDDSVPLLAEALNLSRADVHGVISYYHDFRTTPPGRHVLKLCQAEACRAMGAQALAEDAERMTGLSLGGSDDALSLEPAYCLGNCALGPAAMFDGRPIGRVDRATLETLVERSGEPVS